METILAYFVSFFISSLTHPSSSMALSDINKNILGAQTVARKDLLQLEEKIASKTPYLKKSR